MNCLPERTSLGIDPLDRPIAGCPMNAIVVVVVVLSFVYLTYAMSMFGVIILGTVLIVGALLFLPLAVLGPIAEQLQAVQ